MRSEANRLFLMRTFSRLMATAKGGGGRGVGWVRKGAHGHCRGVRREGGGMGVQRGPWPLQRGVEGGGWDGYVKGLMATAG